MIIFSAVLVAAAIGVLAAGAIDGNLAVVYLSIGLSVLAALLLAAGVVRQRAAIFGEPAAATQPPRPGTDVPTVSASQAGTTGPAGLAGAAAGTVRNGSAGPRPGGAAPIGDSAPDAAVAGSADAATGKPVRKDRTGPGKRTTPAGDGPSPMAGPAGGHAGTHSTGRGRQSAPPGRQVPAEPAAAGSGSQPANGSGHADAPRPPARREAKDAAAGLAGEAAARAPGQAGPGQVPTSQDKTRRAGTGWPGDAEHAWPEPVRRARPGPGQRTPRQQAARPGGGTGSGREEVGRVPGATSGEPPAAPPGQSPHDKFWDQVSAELDNRQRESAAPPWPVSAGPRALRDDRAGPPADGTANTAAALAGAGAGGDATPPPAAGWSAWTSSVADTASAAPREAGEPRAGTPVEPAGPDAKAPGRSQQDEGAAAGPAADQEADEAEAAPSPWSIPLTVTDLGELDDDREWKPGELPAWANEPDEIFEDDADGDVAGPHGPGDDVTVAGEPEADKRGPGGAEPDLAGTSEAQAAAAQAEAEKAGPDQAEPDRAEAAEPDEPEPGTPAAGVPVMDVPGAGVPVADVRGVDLPGADLDAAAPEPPAGAAAGATTDDAASPAAPDEAAGPAGGPDDPAGAESGAPPTDVTDGPAGMLDAVTIVPGVARYHRAGCILIRFLADGDLEQVTREEAQARGCAPCRACEPDKAGSGSE